MYSGSEGAAEGLVEEGLHQFVEGGELSRFDVHQAFGLHRKLVKITSDQSLDIDRRDDVDELALLRDDQREAARRIARTLPQGSLRQHAEKLVAPWR